MLQLYILDNITLYKSAIPQIMIHIYYLIRDFLTTRVFTIQNVCVNVDIV